MSYRVLVTGSRSWYAERLADRVVKALAEKHGEDLVIVVGDCPTGIDVTFANAAIEAGVKIERHLADWDRFGKSAGPRRNTAMIASGVDLCLAFHPHLSISKGTRDCVNQSLKAGIPTWWCYNEGEPPVRQRLPKRVETSVADLLENRS